jgi:hypothetical protein
MAWSGFSASTWDSSRRDQAHPDTAPGRTASRPGSQRVAGVTVLEVSNALRSFRPLRTGPSAVRGQRDAPIATRLVRWTTSGGGGKVSPIPFLMLQASYRAD